MDSYFSPPRNTHKKHRHSTPLSPLREIPKYNSPQDTNYIGITITDQDDSSKVSNPTWTQQQNNDITGGDRRGVDVPQSYRYSFNGLGDLPSLQRSELDTQQYDSFANRPEQQSRQQNLHHLYQQQHLDQSRVPSTNKSTGLSRHASMTLPPINTNQRAPQPKLSTSTTTTLSDGPRSATLPLQHTSSFLSSPLTQGSSQHLPPSSSSLLNRLSQPNLSLPDLPTSNTTEQAHSTQKVPPSLYLNSSLHQDYQATSTTVPTSPYSPVNARFAHNSQQPALAIPTSTTRTSHRRTNSSSVTSTTQSSNSGAFRKVFGRLDVDPLLLRNSSSDPSKPLISMTKNLNTTYQKCNHGFQYSSTRNPRRVLTKPSKPGGNDGYDNDDFDYILYVNDILGSADGHRYIILDVLGSGTFGQVVKCKNTKTQELYAVKVVKNKLAYFKQSMMEVTILEMLNQRFDANDQHHILRLKDTFIHRKHLCLVFELMSVNLYELIKQNQFRGLSTNLVRVFTAQILDSLTVLNEARIIHCDLKPENILLRNLESPTIKVIDFGSACHEVQTMYTYIQSRFYRSPEVLVGLPYTSAIDMWSLGCIAAELFLGLPLFPGSSEYNQVSRIVDMLGLPPAYMIEMGKNSHRYFDRRVDDQGQKHYRLRSMEQYSMEYGKQEQPSKRYFSATTLPELITTYPMIRKDSMTPKEIEKETQSRLAFVDFLQGLLNLNHFERWSPQQAKQHPFITGEPFNGRFTPPFIPRSQSSIKIPPPMPHVSVDQLDLSTPPYHQYELQQNASQPPLSIRGYMENNHHYDNQQSYLSPAYSSLPDIYTDQSQQQQQYQQSALSQGGLVSKYHGDNVLKRSSYNLQRVLEPPEDQFSGGATMEPSFMPSLQAYHHHQDQTQQQQQQQNLGFQSATSMNGRPRANTVGTMQVPPPIQLATLDAVTSNTDGRKLGSISERTLQLSDMDSPSSSSLSSSPLLQQYNQQQQQQQQQQQHENRTMNASYADFQVNIVDSSSGHGDNYSSLGGSTSLAPSISTSMAPYQSTTTNFQPHPSSHPINIRTSTSSNHHTYYANTNEYDMGHLQTDASKQSTPPQKLQHAYQQQQRNRHRRQQERLSTWRSSIGNMSSIDLERDADWTEERDSPPPLNTPTTTSFSLNPYPQPSSSTSPLPFANMTIQNSTSTSHRSVHHHHQQHTSHHRRSHSSVQFADMLPPVTTCSPSTSSSTSFSNTNNNTSSSIISRSSVASNVASLHRRVRGHPPLIQPYHRQDLEWDGVHSIPSYQQLQQQQQQVHLPSFHHHMATGNVDHP